MENQDASDNGAQPRRRRFYDPRRAARGPAGVGGSETRVWLFVNVTSGERWVACGDTEDAAWRAAALTDRRLWVSLNARYFHAEVRAEFSHPHHGTDECIPTRLRHTNETEPIVALCSVCGGESEHNWEVHVAEMRAEAQGY